MYNVTKTLPYSVELYRQFHRKRTFFAYLFVVALPIIVAGAVKFGPSGHSGGPARLGSGSIDLIISFNTNSELLFPFISIIESKAFFPIYSITSLFFSKSKFLLKILIQCRFHHLHVTLPSLSDS